MAEQVLENVRSATETVIRAQHEMFQRWAGYWKGGPTLQAPAGEQAWDFQKRWVEACTDSFGKQRDALEGQWNAVLNTVDSAFRLTEAGDPEQFLGKVLDFWQKGFESWRQLVEAELRDFQAAVAGWAALLPPHSASPSPAGHKGDRTTGSKP